MLKDLSEKMKQTGQYILALCGNKSNPIALQDEKSLNSAQGNMQAIIDMRKTVVEHYKPLKDAARKPYQKLIDEEKSWLKPIEDAEQFVDSRIKDYNNRMRQLIHEREQKEAEERSKLNNETPVEVPERKLKSSGTINTVSEREVISDLQITNHLEFCMALLETGNQNIIQLDNKTLTAFKKILLANRGMIDFPGIKYRREFDTTYRKK